MTAHADKSLSRGFSADMSPDAVLQRLKIVDELYQLGKLLATARRVGKVEDLQLENDARTDSSCG